MTVLVAYGKHTGYEIDRVDSWYIEQLNFFRSVYEYTCDIRDETEAPTEPAPRSTLTETVLVEEDGVQYVKIDGVWMIATPVSEKRAQLGDVWMTMTPVPAKLPDRVLEDMRGDE